MINKTNREVPVDRPPAKIRLRSFSISQLVEKMETEPGFSFARISDGGFFCMQGRNGYNCDGAPYSPKQAHSLLSVIRDPSITHGITSIALHEARAAQWLEEKGIDIEWYDADVMNKASDTGNLFPFIELLRKRRNLICGPTHLKNFGGIPVVSFVECHGSRAFEEVDELEIEISFRVDREDIDTVLLSAGQGASPTLVSWLAAAYGAELNVIDVGSLWDPYVHVFSRSGHKRRGWEEYKRLGRKNFQMEIESW